MAKVLASETKEVKLADHTTPWLCMRENEQQLKLELFKQSQSNIYVFIGMQLIVCYYILMNKIHALIYFPGALTGVSFFIGMFFPFIFGFVIIILRVMKYLDHKTYFIDSINLSTFIKYLESFYVLGTCIAFSISVIVVGYNGKCKGDDDFGSAQGCSQSAEHQMPEDMMMFCVILPALFSNILKGAKWEFCMAAFVISVALMFFTMFNFDLTISLASLCLFIPIAMIVMYENQRQSISLFLLTQNQKNLLEENERLAAETHANELRHMIGNVAHDLKTPLSAFVSGIENINSLFVDLDPPTSTKSRQALNQIVETILNMKNTNEFMIMTINRCIDYTKASNGLKLVPRLETISFMDAINLPLNCMKGLQDSKIKIKLLPVSRDICPYIITDKQWLQENILCLLSNAVKYSAGGIVSVAALLVDGHSNGSKFIRMEIEDTGIGMNEETMNSLFNAFKQAQRLAGGTGLGLFSLARRIESLGGQYGVQNRKDGTQGSLFWFTVPYRPDHTVIETSPLPTSRGITQTLELALKTLSGDSPLVSVRRPPNGSPPDNNNNNTNNNNNSNSNLNTNGNGNGSNSRNGHSRTHSGNNSSNNINGMINNSNNNNNSNMNNNGNNNNNSGTNSPNKTNNNSNSNGNSLNILLVDDSLSILKMSSMMLRRQGHTVTTAENGAEALELLKEQIRAKNEDNEYFMFDVVLMDLQMPVMDGLESTKRLRILESQNKLHVESCVIRNNNINNNRNSNTSDNDSKNEGKHDNFYTIGQQDQNAYASHQLIIGVSANSDNETMEAAFTAGIDAFIPKPFNMQCFNDTYKLARQSLIDNALISE